MAALIHPRWRYSDTLLIAVLFYAMASPSAAAMMPTADETQVRAAMVFNLTKFVEWPPWKFVDGSAPLILCFMINDPVGDDTASLIRDRQPQARQSQDRPVVVRRVVSLEATESCHIFYASKLDKKKLTEATPGFAKSAVLTISDDPTGEGSVIALPLVENRVRILIDLRAAQKSGLTLSSKLLRIATITR